MEFQISDLLVKVQFLKSKLKEIYFHIPEVSFPKTPGLGSIKSLMQKLEQQRSHDHDFVAGATYEIKAVHKDLGMIVHNYGHVFNKKEWAGSHTQLVDAGYQVEYLIDSTVGGRDLASDQLMWLYHLAQVIRQVKEQLTNCSENSSYDADSYEYSYIDQPSEDPRIPEREFMVGFEEEREIIIDRLTRGTNRLEVISILGMPGIGKTTLAKNIYQSPEIRCFFDILIWCTVSQVYSKRESLLSMLRNLVEVGDDMIAMTDEYLCDKMRKLLKGKRYLIVMDDVWSREALYDLKSSFPDDSCGSRILMTGRFRNGLPNPYPLALLSDYESLMLLEMKIFGGEPCPPELQELAMQAARGCKGLPLAIVAVAGLLAKQEMHKWQETVHRLTSPEIDFDEGNDVLYILNLSYRHLPDDLKECLLYFSIYPEDEKISVRKLLWLWIAEGFIPKEEFKSLEDVAEEYLMELIKRNMVIGSKRGSDGKMKKCQVHDLLLDLYLLKAKDAQFSQPLRLGSGIHYENFNPSEFMKYRLPIYGDPEHFIATRPPGPYVRSLLFFTSNEWYPGCDNDMSFISENFKLLKVLDLESVNVGSSLEDGVDLPIHLRYLGVGGDMDALPPSLSKLQNLETLVVKGLMNKFILPHTIWGMKRLRHIHVTNHSIFRLQHDEDGLCSLLDSLVSLSMPSFLYGEETNLILTRLPNLRKLKCNLLEPRVGSKHVPQPPEFGCLLHLESLKLSYSGRPIRTSVQWSLPSSLKQLTLSNFRLAWDEISAIGRLPNLKALQLISSAFEGSIWEMRDEEFVKLRYLKLDSLNIVSWNADSEHLPSLEKLVLRNCKQLEEVPLSFGEICTLERIEVHKCGISVAESVRMIAEQHSEMGNLDFNYEFS